LFASLAQTKIRNEGFKLQTRDFWRRVASKPIKGFRSKIWMI